MSNDSNTVFNKKYLTKQEAYSFYKDNAKKRQIKNTPDLSSYRKIIMSFYEKIGEKMIENKGGVFIGGFGYFVVLLNPNRKVQTPAYDKDCFYLNAHSNSRVYHPCFIPMSSSQELRVFTMDRAFSKAFKVKLSKKIISGQKYRNYFPLLFSAFRKKKRYD